MGVNPYLWGRVIRSERSVAGGLLVGGLLVDDGGEHEGGDDAASESGEHTGRDFLPLGFAESVGAALGWRPGQRGAFGCGNSADGGCEWWSHSTGR